MKDIFINTSVAEIESTIGCANANGQPFSLERLRSNLDYERRSTGARSAVVKLLEREIRRQEKAAA